MSGNGAFEDSMGQELEIFMEAVRETVPARPSPVLESELVPRLAEEARLGSAAGTLSTGADGSRDRPAPAFGSRRALVAKVAVAVALIPAMLAGLAFAGVTVPGAARSAFESVGVELPNQPATDDGDAGTSAEDADDQGSPGSPGSPGDGGASAGSKPETAPGQAKAKPKRDQGGEKPGRRVQRHGEGPVPGPASPPEGKALGHSKDTGKSDDGSAGAQSRGKSGSAPKGGQSGAHGKQ